MKNKINIIITSILTFSLLLAFIPCKVAAKEAENIDETSIQRAYVYELVIGGMCKSLGGTTYYIELGTIAMLGRSNGRTVLWAPDGTLDGNALFEIEYYDIYGNSYDKGSASGIHKEYETGYACPLES